MLLLWHVCEEFNQISVVIYDIQPNPLACPQTPGLRSFFNPSTTVYSLRGCRNSNMLFPYTFKDFRLKKSIPVQLVWEINAD